MAEEPVNVDLIVEDGSGRADADTYATIEEADERVRLFYGNVTEWTGATLAQRTTWLRRAAGPGIDMIFGEVWQGVRKTQEQALDWPRLGVMDRRNARLVDSNEIPRGIKSSQIDLAVALAYGIDPFANLNPNDSEARDRFAISRTDRLAGGFEESRTFERGAMLTTPAIHRMHQYANPFLVLETNEAGMA